MDYEKYYKKDYEGIYHLHFLNKDRFNEAEIMKIFSVYGTVIRVNFSKDETGYTFVQYRSLQETICCLNGLKDGSKIQLLPERSKINSLNKRNRNSSQQQESRIESTFKKTFNSDEQLNSNSIYNKNLPNNGESFTRMKKYNEYDGSDNLSDTDYQNSMHKSNLNVVRGNESDLSVFDGKSTLSSKQTSTETSPWNFTDSTMDYEKYYRISKENTYIVHFFNKKELSKEQITDLFSPYGDVLSVYGNNKFTFVTYRTVEEIIKCLKGLQNSNIISILPQKDKMGKTKTADQRNLNQWQAARTEDTSQRTFSMGKQFNSDSVHNENFPENGKWPNHNTKTYDLDKCKDIDYFSDTASHSSRQSGKFNENEIRYKNTSLQMPTHNEKYLCMLKQQNLTNNEDYDHTIREKQQETKLYPSKVDTDIKPDRNIGISTYDYKIRGLISNTEIKSNESDMISDSLSSNGIRNSSSKIVKIPMQEIIVANIHTSYGIHYILHLFEKHDPISATFVKTISENDIRYCHVYFKTLQDAIAVEEEFDNFNLYGKNLIVLRTSRLINKTL